MYSSKIFEIFKNPSNAGGLQGSNGIGKYIDENCGDFVKIYLKIDDNQEIIEARFKTMGSVGSIVASSVLCQLLDGLTIAEAQELTADDILEVTGEYPTDKMYSLDFAIRALNLAIADYFQKLEKEEKPKRGKKSEEQEEKPKKEKKAKKEKVEISAVEIAHDEIDEEIQDIDVDNETPEDEEQQIIDESREEKDPFTAFAEAVENEENDGLDPVDIFLRSMDDMSVKNMASGDSVSITTITDTKEDPKATKMLEDAKSFTPVVETKILSDEDLKKLEANKKNVEGDKQVSSAKALFDAMFEE